MSAPMLTSAEQRSAARQLTLAMLALGLLVLGLVWRWLAPDQSGVSQLLLGVASLRDVLESSVVEGLPEPYRRRARHVVSENLRVLQQQALVMQDTQQVLQSTGLIGQEVMVQFMENDIDRPIIIGALYNGQGEGGQVPTPGGKSDRDSDASVFQSANDHGVSGQGNLGF